MCSSKKKYRIQKVLAFQTTTAPRIFNPNQPPTPPPSLGEWKVLGSGVGGGGGLKIFFWNYWN